MKILVKIFKWGQEILCDECFEFYDGENHEECPYCNEGPD